MFCEQCGSEILDVSNGCIKCKNIIKKSNEYITESNETILLEVKPTIKFSAIYFSKVLGGVKAWFLIYIIFITIQIIPILSTINKDTQLESNAFMMIKIYTIAFLAIVGFKIIINIFKSLLSKKQNENYAYLFYKDRVVVEDKFLNLSKKELKYMHIREIVKKQNIMERVFNIGKIKLYNTAESGISNGIFMSEIEDVDIIYKKVKEIVNRRSE